LAVVLLARAAWSQAPIGAEFRVNSQTTSGPLGIFVGPDVTSDASRVTLLGSEPKAALY
jgi:hypothetical protein